MIISKLLDIIFSVLHGMINILPATKPLPVEFTSGITTIKTYTMIVNSIVPVGLLFECLGIVMIAELANVAWHNSKWFVSTIRGTSYSHTRI